jgi:hypothetical protein
MLKQLLSKEFLKMQKIAGLITESQYLKLLEDQTIVDRILDKISAQGIESLTPKEKEYLKSNGKSSIPNLGTTEVYISEPEDTELYKIENFPSMPNAVDVDFDCDNTEETCLNTPEMANMLKDNDFKKIINKIGSHYKSTWDDSNSNLSPFHYINFNGDFSNPLDVVYAQVAGDSGLIFVDTLNRFNVGYKTEEEWGVKEWKKL